MRQRSVVAVVGLAHDHGQSLPHASGKTGIRSHHTAVQAHMRPGHGAIDAGQADDIPHPPRPPLGIDEYFLQDPLGLIIRNLVNPSHGREDSSANRQRKTKGGFSCG